MRERSKQGSTCAPKGCFQKFIARRKMWALEIYFVEWITWGFDAVLCGPLPEWWKIPPKRQSLYRVIWLSGPQETLLSLSPNKMTNIPSLKVFHPDFFLMNTILCQYINDPAFLMNKRKLSLYPHASNDSLIRELHRVLYTAVYMGNNQPCPDYWNKDVCMGINMICWRFSSVLSGQPSTIHFVFIIVQ